jgi:hypothetical protein
MTAPGTKLPIAAQNGHVTDDQDTRLPIDARASAIVLAAQLEALESVIGAIEKRIKMQHRSSASQRVEAIPGIGVIGAIPPKGARRGREEEM